MESGLEILLNRWLDDDLPAAEVAEVEQALRDDRDARHVFYEMLLLDQMLTEDHVR